MKLVSTLGFASLCMVFQVQAADFSRWGMSYSNEDNVTRAAWDKDKRSDDIIGLKYLSGRFTATDKGSGYSLSYHTRYENYLTYHGLNNLGIGGSVGYRHKFGLGHNVWYWNAGLDGSYSLFNDSDRSNLHLSADLTLGKRFLDRWNAQLFTRYLNEDASAAVFDRSGRELGWRLNFSISNRWLVYASGLQYSGNITVTQSSSPTAHDVWGTDNVFAGMSTYLVDVNTAITRYGINYALDTSSSLGLSSEHWAAQGAQDLSYWYYKNILRLSFNKVI